MTNGTPGITFSQKVTPRPMTTTVTSKGQVTLPKAIREAAGIKPGDKVDIRATASGGIYIEKPGTLRAYDARLNALANRPLVRDGMTTDEFMEFSRGELVAPRRRQEMTLVDTNVLLDVASADPLWLQWSIQQVAKRAALGPVIINDVVYAEMSAQMDTEAELRQALRELDIVLERVPTRRFFSPARSIAVTVPSVAFAPECFPTSSSARTRRRSGARS